MTVEEIVQVNLDNEMDLILAHKRTMKLAELCGLSLSAQTTFATAVSEIARAAISYGKKSYLILAIDFHKLNRKEIVAVLYDQVDLNQVNPAALSYAKKLMGDLQTSLSSNLYSIRINHRIPFSGTISASRIESFKQYFENEPPLSPYDEIRKKNVQLIDLSKKLSESENQYRVLTDTLPLMLFSINNSGEITYSNKWMIEFIGIPTTGSLWYLILCAEDYHALVPEWEKAMHTKTSFRAQGRIKSKNKWIWHLISLVPVKNEKDLITSWIGSFVDIHAQKLIEETLKDNKDLKEMQTELLTNKKELEKKNTTLRRQNDFIHTVIDASQDYIAVIDMNENLVTFNASYEKMTGIKKQDVIGKKITTIVPSLADSPLYDDIHAAMKGDEVHRDVYFSNYNSRYYETFYIPLKDLVNEVYGVVLLGHDITNQMAHEQELKDINEQLVRRNHELEQFAYIASHDLQEPLRKIKTFSTLLQKDLTLNEKQEIYFNKIVLSSERMSRLIKDVLNYSKLSSNEDLFCPVDLNETLQNVLQDFELLMQEKNASVNIGSLPVVTGIPLHLTQLFSNLVSNSLKFTEKDPVIYITAEVVEGEEVKMVPSLESSKRYHKITIQDNGIGFDQQYASQIFVIFQRLNPRQRYSGTGIGLALCKKIVENHQGIIAVHSRINEGTTFTIFLPA